MLKARDVIAGRYRLDSPIGEGAMGAVWRAEDQTLKRQVAIKFLFVRGARDPQAMVDQFLREARIAASVQHRNVIHTVDFGTVDDFQPFMVMELLSGESLGERMARKPPLSNEQFIHIVSLTLRGLSAVHDAGIVHRDLKPHNIFLQRDTDAVFPKILDFGISRSLNGGEDRPSAIATQEGMIVGTPDYMSPEQARGERNIDRRADIYSMGAILFEGLTGRLPFVADTIGDLIVQIVTGTAPRAIDIDRNVPQALSDLVAQAMSRNREHRFADARALRRALLAAAEVAWSRSGRIAASMAPGPVSAGSGAGILSPPPPPSAPFAALLSPEVGPSKPIAPAASFGGSGQGGAWGDFEGLESPGIRDDNPPPPNAMPSSPPPKQQRLVAHSHDSLLDLPAHDPNAPLFGDLPAPSATPAIPARAKTQARKPERAPSSPQPAPNARANGGTAAQPRPAPPPSKGKAPPPGVGRVSNADMLDPLYEGREQATPDVDYDRVRSQTLVAKEANKETPKRGRASAPRAQATAAARKPRRSALSSLAWLLPIAALLAGAYVLYGPVDEAPGAAQIADPAAAAPANGSDGPLPARSMPKSRRDRPGAAPAHMRDVVF